TRANEQTAPRNPDRRASDECKDRPVGVLHRQGGQAPLALAALGIDAGTQPTRCRRGIGRATWIAVAAVWILRTAAVAEQISHGATITDAYRSSRHSQSASTRRSRQRN